MTSRSTPAALNRHASHDTSPRGTNRPARRFRSMIRLPLAIALAAFALAPALAAYRPPPPMTAASIDAAAPEGERDSDSPLIAKAEILLDRAHFSPGEIDGEDGDNFRQ